MISESQPTFSVRLERAIRRASEWHREQNRKGSNIPYITHPFSVAMILDRMGYPEDVVIAGLLHDVVEDCEVPLSAITNDFGSEVAAIVAAVSEEKTDATGSKRPWTDRKRDHLTIVANSPAEARAVALADKLHNLSCIRMDLESGRPAWSIFNASRSEVIAYHREGIERFGVGDVRLQMLASACREVLERISAENPEEAGEGG